MFAWQILFFQIFVFQHVVDLLGGQGTLQFLAIKQFSFQLLNGLAGLDKGFTNFAITATIAGGNQISNTTAFEEGGQFAAGIHDFNEANHFHQAQTNDSSLGIVTQAQAINETGAHGNNVLKINCLVF